MKTAPLIVLALIALLAWIVCPRPLRAGEHGEEEKKEEKPKEKEGEMKFQFTGLRRGLDLQRTFVPVLCYEGLRENRQECKDTLRRKSYEFTYTTLNFGMPIGYYRDKFLKMNPEDPMLACIEEIEGSANSEFEINIEEFAEFARGICVQAGVNEPFFKVEEW